MSDFCGKDIADRLPMVITGHGINQLLCVPKIASGTGENMATAVYNAFQDWNVSENIKSLCFDTTRSNTGLKKEARTLIEQTLATNTMRFFNILDLDYSFLEIEPLQLKGLESYENVLKAAQHLKITIDISERGVAFIQQYNMLHTRDEKMKQYLLQVVQEHRKKFPSCKKTVLNY